MLLHALLSLSLGVGGALQTTAELGKIQTPRGIVKLGDPFATAPKVLMPEGVMSKVERGESGTRQWLHPRDYYAHLVVKGNGARIEQIDWSGSDPAKGRAKLAGAIAKFGKAHWSVDEDGCAIYAWQSGDIVRVHTIFDATGETSECILVGRESLIRAQGFPFDNPATLLEALRKAGIARPKPLPASAGADPITGTWAGDLVNPLPDGQNGMVYAYRIVFSTDKTFHLEGVYADASPKTGTWSFDGKRVCLAAGSSQVVLAYDPKNAWLSFPGERSPKRGTFAVLRRIKL